MAETTNIAWTDATFNPWIGCTKVSPGCDGCYAAVSTPARTFGVKWGAGEARRRTSPSNWQKPIRWNELAAKGLMPDGKTPTNGRRPRVFCASLADVFDNEVDSAWREDLFGLVYRTPNLDWLLLTKRIGNAAKMLPWASPKHPDPWPNVWLGASIVNQQEADRDVPKLLATRAAVRFVSYEPALGPVDFTRITGMVRPETGGKDWIWTYDALRGQNMTCKVGTATWAPAGFHGKPVDRWPKNEGARLNWIIVGGESSQPGHQARPFDIQWARDTVRQCRQAGVACFVKQMGSAPEWNCRDEDAEPPYWGALKYRDRAGADPTEWPADLRVQEFPR